MSYTSQYSAYGRVPNFTTFLEKIINPYETRQYRIPFYMTSSLRRRQGVPGVSMLINPTSVSFSQSKRISVLDTQAGKVFFHWTDESGRNNDILTVGFSGNTGNIDLRNGGKLAGQSPLTNNKVTRALSGWANDVGKEATQTDDEDPQRVVLKGGGYTASGVGKVSNFWNLYSLTREPVIDTDTGSPVYYYITCSLPILAGTYLTFIGHFNEVLSFSEDASSPFNKQYSFSFSCLYTQPDLNDVYNSVGSYLSTMFVNNLG
jgi:hypothetical protein